MLTDFVTLGRAGCLTICCADACRTPRHFGQVVHLQAVSVPLPFQRFHDVLEVVFLVDQQKTERVYLGRMHIRCTTRLQGSQQAVDAQSLGVVMMTIGIVPTNDALAQQREVGDAAVDSMMSRRSCRISADSAYISLIRWRPCTRMAAMLQMTTLRIDSLEVFLPLSHYMFSIMMNCRYT